MPTQYRMPVPCWYRYCYITVIWQRLLSKVTHSLRKPSSFRTVLVSGGPVLVTFQRMGGKKLINCAAIEFLCLHASRTWAVHWKRQRRTFIKQSITSNITLKWVMKTTVGLNPSQSSSHVVLFREVLSYKGRERCSFSSERHSVRRNAMSLPVMGFHNEIEEQGVCIHPGLSSPWLIATNRFLQLTLSIFYGPAS